MSYLTEIFPFGGKRRLLRLVRLTEQAGAFDNALECYQRALDRRPQDPELWAQLARVLGKLGHGQRAAGAMAAAAELAPGEAEYHLELAYLLRQLNRRRQAAQAYARGVTLDGRLAASYPELADLAAEAEIVSDTGQPPLQRRKKPGRITIADRARDAGHWRLAARMYRKALDNRPDRGPIWEQYGHVCNEAGDRAEALSAYRKAIACDPTQPTGYLHLGHVLKDQGRSEDAEACYLRAFLLDETATTDVRDALEHFGWGEAGLDMFRRLRTQSNGSGGDASEPSSLFDPEWYLKRYPELAQANVDPVSHYLKHGAAEGRTPSPAGAAHYPVTDAEIRCLKAPLFGDEVVLFASYSPDGVLKSHVMHYLRSFAREGISVALIITCERDFVPDAELLSQVDGLFVREAQGFDFAAWAHVLRLHPEFFEAKRLYLANDSMFGPTTQPAFARLVGKIRESSADLVGATESNEIAWHIQSYFLAVNERLLSSDIFKDYISKIVAFEEKEDTVTTYELDLAQHFQKNGFRCEGIFKVNGSDNPTLIRWRELLLAGLPFLKASVPQDRSGKVDASGWKQLLADQGYDVGLTKGTLAAARRPVAAPLRRKLGKPTRVDVLQWEKEIELSPAHPVSLDTPLGIFVHIFYEEIAEEIAAHLAQIELPKRIYVSTKPREKKKRIAAIFKKHGLEDVTEIVVVPDYGTDIAPFLIEFSDKFADHDICLKIHSKRSLQHRREFGERWRGHLFRELLHDNERVCAIVNTFLADPDLGILLPHHNPANGPEATAIGPNYEGMLRILRNIDVYLDRDQEIEFGVGSMFWFRGAALAELANLGFEWRDFGHGVDRRDGTLAHAMERCFLFFAAKAGMEWGFIPPLLSQKFLSYKMSRRRTMRLIRESGLFDEEYYRETNIDVAQAGADPLAHWVDSGHREGRNPSPHFDTEFYITQMPPQYPNALVHYLLDGRSRGLPTELPAGSDRTASSSDGSTSPSSSNGSASPSAGSRGDTVERAAPKRAGGLLKRLAAGLFA